MVLNCSICRKKSVTGLVSLRLECPSSEKLMKAREHLKYWRFVKEFHEVDERSIRVTVSIGKDLCPKKWKEYCELGMNLMNSAVKQYEGEFVSTMLEDVWFCPIVTSSTFIRPDADIEPLYNLFNNK